MTMGKQQAVVGCAIPILCLALWTGAHAQVSGDQGYAFWSSKNTKYCKVGGDAGWNIGQGNNSTSFLQDWADNSSASSCHVLVFTSAPGAKHTVNVLATSNTSLTAASVCQDPSLKGVVGRNRFATNVSLIVLRSRVTYWFVSGVEGECAAGLVFRVQALAGTNISFSGSARDVGVAYNMEGNAALPQGSGGFAPAQPAFVTGTSQRTVFYGDALNGVFSDDDQVQTLLNRGPVSCTNSTMTTIFAFGTSPGFAYLSVFMQPAENFDHAIVVRVAHFNTSTGTTQQQLCEAGTRVADVLVAQIAGADDCSLNPGAPYLCPPAVTPPPQGNDAGLNIKAPGTSLVFVSLLLLLH